MSDPLTQYWRGASTVNVVWLVQTRLGGHDDFDCNWVTDSVWGDAVNEVLDCQDEQIQGLSQRCDELEAQVHALQCDLRAEKAEIHKLLTRNRDLIRDNAVLENALVTIKRWIDTGQFDAEACRQWIISHIGKAKK